MFPRPFGRWGLRSQERILPPKEGSASVVRPARPRVPPERRIPDKLMADENTPHSLSRGSTEGLALDNAVLRIDKGRVSPPSAGDEAPRAPRPEHIPWGYGRDRLTAMVVDPNRLYLYWELTDHAIDKAREGLGPGGKDAWLSLRIYDVTGRIF